MYLIYMATTVSKNGPQIGNNRDKRRDRYRDGDVATMKRYTRRRRGGDRNKDRDQDRDRDRRRNKRTEYSRRRRRN